MRITVLTLFPELLKSPLQESILKRAQEKGLLQVDLVNIRDFAPGRHKQVDDLPYGGGAGMVMMPEPLFKCLETVKNHHHGPVIYLSPTGKHLTQTKVERLAKLPDLTLLCGHYEGIDQRVIDTLVDEEISIGDYVLTGGELPALVVIDAVTRLLPGVLGKEESHAQDSFSKAFRRRKEYPHYTRPPIFRNQKVPAVLLSGNHAEIERWRRTHLR